MTKFLYFAYGSNMLTKRLQKRCPSARPVGPATATNFRLEFSKRSKDESGKATLVEDTDQKVYGVLFEISRTEQSGLDRAEGVGNGYSREDQFPVTRISDDCPINATTYLATNTEPDLLPYDWYRALCPCRGDPARIAQLARRNALQGEMEIRPHRLSSHTVGRLACS